MTVPANTTETFVPIASVVLFFVSLLIVWMYFVNRKKAPGAEWGTKMLKSFGKEENGWILLLLLQAVYLGLDVTEAATGNASFGIIAAIFMLSLGSVAGVMTLIDWSTSKHLSGHGVVESLFYMAFGAALLVLRKKHQTHPPPKPHPDQKV
jgi:hypothetical protein